MLQVRITYPTPGQSSRGQHFQANRAPGRTRTCDLPLRRRELYPLSYGGSNLPLIAAHSPWAAQV